MMEKENNGTSSHKEPSVHFKTDDPETVRVGSVSSSSPARRRRQNSGCLDLPMMFERAGSWWPNPKFDSQILEKEQWKSYFPQTRRRFQYALFYIFIACIAWTIFFGATKQYSHQWPYCLAGTLILLCIVGLLIGFTYTKYYKKLYLVTSIFVSCLVCCSILLTLINTESDLSTIGAFTATVEVLLMMYSVIPMPLFVTVIIGVVYSILFETLTAFQNHFMQAPVFLIGKVLLHLCIHLMGVHIFTMRQVRQRSTFWKIGQSVIARKDLQLEKQIKEKMIHSLMPPSVASEVMRTRNDKEEDPNEPKAKKRNSKTKTLGKGEIIFRCFNMNRMENVSILFADIVGFTKMSSNKTAEVLVGQLNDLFGRFDVLCTKSGCEKISTLGDCYYCVSGCPEPREDHAKCCVEMGLGIIDAIVKFDEDYNEQVNMRVGVHTGTVLCGIVGTRRFKFDVWSNDVFLANIMESSGEPGRVHISEASYAFLKDEYEVEKGEDQEDNRSEKKLVEAYDKDTSQYAVKHAKWDKMIKTYFIVGKAKKKPADVDLSMDVGNKPDTVAVSMDGDASALSSESDNLMNNTSLADPETGDANGVPTTAQLVSSHLNNSLKNLDEKGRVNPASPTSPTQSSIKSSLASSPSLRRAKLASTKHESLTKYLPTNSTTIQYPNLSPSSPQSHHSLPYPLSITHSPQSSPTIKPKPTKHFTKNPLTISLSSSPKRRKRIQVPIPMSAPNTPKLSPSASPVQLHQKMIRHMSAMSALSAMGTAQLKEGELPFVPDEDITLEPIDKTWTKIRNLNYHTDMHIVKCIQEGITNKEYFYKPPINKFTLTFQDTNLEVNYRDHYMEDEHNYHTLSAPKYHSFLEILISFLVFTIISMFCFIVFDRKLPWLIFFGVSLLLELLNLLRAVLTIKYGTNIETVGGCWYKVVNFTSAWYFRNILGAVVASIPLLGVFTNFSCLLMNTADWNDRFFCFCIVVSLLHYTNFTTLSSWMKSILAFIAGVVLIILIAIVKCTDSNILVTGSNLTNIVTQIVIASTPFSVNSSQLDLTDNTTFVEKEYIPLFSGVHVLQFEIILDMLLLIVLIGFLNRESEISYRLNYHGDAQAWEYKQIMQEHKDQADWLLHNIIPEHVSDVVGKTTKYSKNHKDVGVIFAAIVNFNEIYDESFEGGREFLRVLNELVSDYEELLDDRRFKDVEKIKTISSTFMAASGLNESSRGQNTNKYAHLYSLMEFCEELHKAIQRFNDSIFNFDFILNIGYNYGEVTAGVIGTTKLLYDIWGDTVNISSRMYSTGVAERTQVPEATSILLGDKMDFSYRGDISVKGKGVMKTFLFEKIKEGAQWHNEKE